MSGILMFDSWRVFRDTFEPYRCWLLLLDRPKLDLKQGDQVFEVGPGTRDGGFDKKPLWDGHRFQVRRCFQEGEAALVIDELEDWQVAGLFGGELPPWPLEGVALQQIRAALKDVMPRTPLAQMGQEGSSVVPRQPSVRRTPGETLS